MCVCVCVRVKGLVLLVVDWHFNVQVKQRTGQAQRNISIIPGVPGSVLGVPELFQNLSCEPHSNVGSAYPSHRQRTQTDRQTGQTLGHKTRHSPEKSAEIASTSAGEVLASACAAPKGFYSAQKKKKQTNKHKRARAKQTHTHVRRSVYTVATVSLLAGCHSTERCTDLGCYHASPRQRRRGSGG